MYVTRHAEEIFTISANEIHDGLAHAATHIALMSIGCQLE